MCVHVSCAQLLVAHGSEVRVGDDLAVIEAMKVGGCGSVCVTHPARSLLLPHAVFV